MIRIIIKNIYKIKEWKITQQEKIIKHFGTRSAYRIIDGGGLSRKKVVVSS